jgi:hypothetical protein
MHDFCVVSRKADVNSGILKNWYNGTQDQYTAAKHTAFGSGWSPTFTFKRCLTAGEKEMLQSSARYAGALT